MIEFTCGKIRVYVPGSTHPNPDDDIVIDRQNLNTRIPISEIPDLLYALKRFQEKIFPERPPC